MGTKHTLYHPISLNILKASFEVAGFEVGRIEHMGGLPSQGWASYRIRLDVFPEGFENKPQWAQLGEINEQFSQDIRVTWIGFNTKHELCVNVTTKAMREIPDEGDLDWPTPERQG